MAHLAAEVRRLGRPGPDCPAKEVPLRERVEDLAERLKEVEDRLGG